jgi:hypothetical protein
MANCGAIASRRPAAEAVTDAIEIALMYDARLDVKRYYADEVNG